MLVLMQINSYSCQFKRNPYILFLSDFDETWFFLTDFSKNIQLWNFMKMPPVEAELFLADGQTDIGKTNSRF